MDPSPSHGEPHGNRLERALEVFLARPPSTADEAAALLAGHPDLRDLLAPMVGEPVAEDVDEDGRVLGDFRLLRELGRGGMGTVHEAWQRSLDRRVAVKLLAPGLIDSPSALARFRREAATVGRLRHPNIVQVHGFGSDQGVAYFAMQMVDGEPLHRCAARFRSPAAAVALVAQIASALEHAHGQGLVHRDVKPGNVLVRDDGHAVLTDFGLASDEALPSLTREGSFLGTLDYSSPEQVRGERADARSDLWALGVILHELLAQHPFRRPTQEGTLHAILTAEPPPLPSGVPSDLAAIVGRLLEKQATRRYAGATALVSDLRAFQAGRPVTARLPTPLERLGRWSRREPWRATALAVLLVGLGSSAIGFVLANRRADDNAALAHSNGVLLQAEAAARLSLASKVEEFDLLAGMTLYERAVQRELELCPAVPSRLDAMRAWLRLDCEPLQALQPKVSRAVAQLAARAAPWTAAEQESDRTTHPDHAAYELARQRLSAVERALAIRAGKAPLTLPEVPAAFVARTAFELNNDAWERVAPRADERKIYGEEALGLALAQLAAQRSIGTDDEDQAHDTLAWALAENGQDEAALAASAHAAAVASEPEKPPFEQYARNVAAAIATRTERRDEFSATVAELGPKIARRRTYEFADPAAQFLFEALQSLEGRLSDLVTHQRARVEQRIAWAQRVRELTFRHPLARVTWDDARAAIAGADGITAHADYKGQPVPLDDDLVLGLVPIGMNPVTRLWEFYDLRSAWDGLCDPATIPIPTHRTDGSIGVDAATGVVFVLLPGGLAALGAQSTHPDAANHDPSAMWWMAPVRRVQLWPFLIARHELTQAQWTRLYDGDEGMHNPSGLPAGSDDYAGHRITGCNPVEKVSWTLADRVLRHHGMALPTEAQWEYACRAGGETPFWSGADGEDLAGVGNVNDATGSKSQPNWGLAQAFDDGYVVHAPVGTFRMNPFGLFDVHGNVAEWCRDRSAVRGSAYRAGDGERTDSDPSGDRSFRGGAFDVAAARARSAMWSHGTPDFRSFSLGVRPARLLRTP